VTAADIHTLEGMNNVGSKAKKGAYPLRFPNGHGHKMCGTGRLFFFVVVYFHFSL